MKKIPHAFRFILVLLIGAALIISCARISANIPAQRGLSAAAFYVQATTTPPVEDQSEIGSTDGIAILGIMIVAIVVLPILLQRKNWLKD